jgi:hypothetical protein
MTNARRGWGLRLNKAILHGTSIRGKFKWLQRIQKHALTKDYVLCWLSKHPSKNIRNKMTPEDDIKANMAKHKKQTYAQKRPNAHLVIL